jgi:predicted thioesterase
MMSLELNVGQKNTKTYSVAFEHTAISMSSGALEVYATPMLIAAMEETCMILAARGLTDPDTTVGTLVNIRHLSPSPVGMEVRVDCELTEIDGRRLVFRVEAHDATGDLIGEGIHERFVIDRERFMAKVRDKKSRI